jgi:hypothetical protein
MRRWLLVAALLLPLAGLVAGIVRQQVALDGATRWVIPITGHDPRDPLRGQYLRFAYAWQVDGDARGCDPPRGCALCLARRQGLVTATIAPPAAACLNRVDPRLSRIDISPGLGPRGQPGFSARIFVSEASAPRLEAQLRSGPMVVVARLAPDGRLMPERVEPAG